MKTVVGFFGLLGIIGVGLLYYTLHNAEPASNFRTTPVVRGDLSSTITATGTVEPEEQVDIGAQVTGKIASFGPDPRARPIRDSRASRSISLLRWKRAPCWRRSTTPCTRPSMTRLWQPWSMPRPTSAS